MGDKVFVTGANGQLGIPLIQALVADGYEVVGLARSPRRKARVERAGATCLLGDLYDIDLLTEGCRDARWVYHLAGAIRGRGRETADRINRMGSANLLAALERAGGQPEGVLFASTCAVYGDRSGLWMEEDMKASPMTRYGLAKAQAEDLFREAHEGRGLPVRIARIGIVYGPGFTVLLEDSIRKAIEESMKPKAGATKGATATTKGGKLELSLTPEARELNADFEKNRGKLPWPVEKGVITSRFGKQPHPVLPGITIENNGVDITTEKGAGVRAVFRGEVASVIVIPGAGKAVILSHGAYRTVYSNMREVSVAKGQKVDTRQVVGTVLTDDSGSIAHIEVWKITSEGLVKVDPGPWLVR